MLTGSIRAETDAETWPGTGRVTRIAVYPMTVGEQLAAPEAPLVDRIARGDLAALGPRASTAAPTVDDARHLAWLRDHTGDQLLAGIVLHTGPAAFPLGDRLWALPISSLWT